MSKQPTFVTLTKLQNREPTLLQTAIDNTCGKLNVALKSFHYEVGYHNADASTHFFLSSYVDPGLGSRAPPATHKFFALQYGGLYTFEEISRFFMESVPGITLRLKAPGLVEFNIPKTIGTIALDRQFRRLLGIGEKRTIAGKYVGDVPVKLIVHKWLYIYLDQLSTTSNIVDGAPSTLLAIIPASPIKGIINTTPSHPTYKKLEVGHIYQLNLLVLDENGTIVQNHDKSMTAVLDIRENDVCSFN